MGEGLSEADAPGLRVLLLRHLVYRRAGKNFNPMMAMAADFVIAEVEEIVEVGQIDPDQVCTPGACVDMVVQL